MPSFLQIKKGLLVPFVIEQLEAHLFNWLLNYFASLAGRFLPRPRPPRELWCFLAGFLATGALVASLVALVWFLRLEIGRAHV